MQSEIPYGLAIALKGELGMGKTLWAKAVISWLTGLEPNEILSPTFTLAEEYEGIKAKKIFHVDLYRLERENELNALDFAELFQAQTVTLVEWAEKAPQWESYWNYEIQLKKIKTNLREIIIKRKIRSIH